jgi:hypothetical protein
VLYEYIVVHLIGMKMVRMQLQRLAFTYILSQCAGRQGLFFKATRMMHSSSQALHSPRFSWRKSYPSWLSAIPTQSTQYSECNQGWSNVYNSRCYSIKMLDENEEVSVPSKDVAAESKVVTKKPLDGGAKFKVVRVNDDGSWHHLSLRTSELVSTVSFFSFGFSLLSDSNCHVG